MDAPWRRRKEAQSLGENLAAVGAKCPIPFTHDRLAETHHWWHDMAHYYHEPVPFRYALGAYVQAARNVTFMLQKEQSVYSDFSWYHEWVEQAKTDAILRGLTDVRTDFVHRQSLGPHSWLEMRCIGNPRHPHGTDEDPCQFKVSPFECTHYYMRLGPRTDHGHMFIRHWSMEGLEGRELLEACADVYDQLDELVSKAHRVLGAEMLSHKRVGSNRTLPCMEETMKHRIARTVVRDGLEVWEDEPDGLHAH